MNHPMQVASQAGETAMQADWLLASAALMRNAAADFGPDSPLGRAWAHWAGRQEARARLILETESLEDQPPLRLVQR
jgi:hypothetical protein